MRSSICLVVCLLALAQLISCWKLAPALEQLRSNVNSFAPNRDKGSDGTIGDAAHSARTSDHNPDSRGIVHALDLTHDPSGGFDSYAFAEHLKKVNDPRIKYVISCRKIWSSGTANWRRYTGSNNHCHHVHISLKSGSQIENNVSPWNVNYKNDPQGPEQIDDDENPRCTSIGGKCQVGCVGGSTRTGLCNGPNDFRCCIGGQSQQEADNANPRCKAVGGKCQVGCVGGSSRTGLCNGPNDFRCCIGGNPIVRSNAPEEEEEPHQQHEHEHEHEPEPIPVELHHSGHKTRVNVDVVVP